MPSDDLRRGDLVEVKDPAAILATLDEHGALEELPFMPEMAAFCGRRFEVDVSVRASRLGRTASSFRRERTPQPVVLGVAPAAPSRRLPG